MKVVLHPLGGLEESSSLTLNVDPNMRLAAFKAQIRETKSDKAKVEKERTLNGELQRSYLQLEDDKKRLEEEFVETLIDKKFR